MYIKIFTLLLTFFFFSSNNVFSQVWAYEGELWALPNYKCPGDEMDLIVPIPGSLYYSTHLPGETPTWVLITVLFTNESYPWIVPGEEGEIVEFKLASLLLNVAPIYSENIFIDCTPPSTFIDIEEGTKGNTDVIILADDLGLLMKTNNDLLQEVALKIGPNPFHNNLNIMWNMSQEAEISIYLYDVTGKRVDAIREQAWAQEGSQQLTYDATHLQTGVYLIEILYNEQRQTFKLIKSQ